MSGSASIGNNSDASAGPSISTAAGLRSSSACTSRRADPGPWWRMPNRDTWPVMISDQVGQRGVVALEPAPLLQYGLEIFAQHSRILHRVLYDCAEHVAGECLRCQLAVVEEGSLADAADHHRDRLRGRKPARGRFERDLAVLRRSGAQSAED